MELVAFHPQLKLLEVENEVTPDSSEVECGVLGLAMLLAVVFSCGYF